MYPILYNIDATSYEDTMGLGILSDAISCDVNIVRNDANTLVLKYPTNGSLAGELTGGKVIAVQSPDWVRPQPYYINKVSKPRKGIITVNAWHASYRLSGVMVKPFTLTSQTSGILGLLSKIEDNVIGDYNISVGISGSDPGGAVSYTLDKITSMRQVLIDVATKFNFNLSFIQFFSVNSGKDYMQVSASPTPGKREAPLYEGIDIERAVYDYDATNAFEGVLPYWKKNDTTVYSNTVIPANLPAYARAIPLDLSSSFDAQPTQAQLAQAGQAYLAKGGGNPVTGWAITVNSNVQDISVGNVVDVALSDGTVITNVIETATFDVLAERYTKITLGNARKTLYKAISGTSGGGIGSSGSAQGPKGDKGDKGDKGADGISPTVTTTAITGGTEITITDATGAHTFSVMDGAKGDTGADGISPTVSTSEITGGSEITITDATGAHTFDVMDGAKGDTGADGYSPTVTVQPIDGGNQVTITDKNGNHYVNVYDGDSAYDAAWDNGWRGDIHTAKDIHYSILPDNAETMIQNGEPIILTGDSSPVRDGTLIIARKHVGDYLMGLAIIGYGKITRRDSETYNWTVDTNREYAVLTGDDAQGEKTIDDIIELSGITPGTAEVSWVASLQGANGFDGLNGTNGTNGTNGVSPAVDVQDIDNGHQVTITDASGAHTFNVMDGVDAEAQAITTAEIDAIAI